MTKYNLNSIYAVARTEYIRWLSSPKSILFFVLIVPLRETIILPILDCANKMQQPLNILEPCISLANSGLILLLIPFAYLTLMADFPCMDANMCFVLSRAGRCNWILGEIVFQFTSLLTYISFIIITTLIQTSHVSYLANAWSLVATDYDSKYINDGSIGMSSLLPPNLYLQMTPGKAFALSYLLLGLSLILWSGLLLWAALYGRKLIGYWLIIANIIIGIAFCTIDTPQKWCFPISHSILWIHYQDYYRAYAFSPSNSLLLFGVLIVTIYVSILKKATSVHLDILSQN
ncbi:MAG TPA: hypothetical protein DHV96_01275 [Lachnospiraceae bacterium]|nr:hypothetical protein [Lachnospiraceae bacterium]